MTNEEINRQALALYCDIVREQGVGGSRVQIQLVKDAMRKLAAEVYDEVIKLAEDADYDLLARGLVERIEELKQAACAHDWAETVWVIKPAGRHKEKCKLCDAERIVKDSVSAVPVS
jgi:hypothetical protein